MTQNNLTKDLSAEQAQLGSKIFSLVIARVLTKNYPELNESDKQNMDMEKIFLLPNFKKLFKEEAKKVEEEIKAEIEKQF